MPRKTLLCGKSLPEESAAAIEAQLDLAKARLKEFLEGEGLNFSGPRWRIAEAIVQSQRHLSSQDIVKLVQAKHPDIGTATIYRSIKVLTEAKVLRETLIDQDGNGVYEAFDESHHDHLICLDCGQIFEFESEDIELAQNRVLDQLGFREERHRHVIYARCLSKPDLGNDTNC